MTKEQMANVMERMCAEEMKTREAGQKEYAHGDAFGNFNRLADELHIDRKIILWIYLKKHFDGILAYLNGHKSQREDVRGRITDARVYLALLRGMIEEEEKFAPSENIFIPGIGSPSQLIRGIAKTLDGTPSATTPDTRVFYEQPVTAKP